MPSLLPRRRTPVHSDPVPSPAKQIQELKERGQEWDVAGAPALPLCALGMHVSPSEAQACPLPPALEDCVWDFKNILAQLKPKCQSAPSPAPFFSVVTA